ncbi:MAG TPA: FoF1 ATP synthase subunit a [Candidatus Binatia bacterium]|jgi:F-type H+-transporting ATPase subunit a|nr:FoF1 ATP synthase subunit a [Candidatus Binatia bacterium]
MSVPVAAEKLFQIGPLPVTNSVLTGWIAVGVFVIAGAALSRKKALVPKGLQNAAEWLIEGMLTFMDQVTNDRARSRRFLPLVGTLFPFILLCNWMGLLPSVGTFGFGCGTKGAECIPLFRPATSDLNLTIAMGVISVIASHVLGIMTVGFFKYGNKFIQLGTVWKALAKIGKVPAGKYAIDLFAALVEFMVGIIELISEAAKMVSLSLRLFGNIFAGEVLIHVLSSLIAYVMPTPFMFLEVIVGIVQALVFSMLTLVYLTIATEKPHGDAHAEEEDAMGEAHGVEQGAEAHA